MNEEDERFLDDLESFTLDDHDNDDGAGYHARYDAPEAYESLHHSTYDVDEVEDDSLLGEGQTVSTPMALNDEEEDGLDWPEDPSSSTLPGDEACHIEGVAKSNLRLKAKWVPVDILTKIRSCC